MVAAHPGYIGAPDARSNFWRATLHVAGSQVPGHYVGAFDVRLFCSWARRFAATAPLPRARTES